MRGAVITALGLAVVACAPRIEEVVLHRSNCEVCHRPLDPATGVPTGIEDAHPWHPLDCTDCHGGKAFVCATATVKVSGGETCPDDAWVYDQSKAHVPKGSIDGNLRAYSAQQLDGVDPTYLRFVNPSDPRVARYGCGGGNPRAGEAGGCHSAAVDAMTHATMTHVAGELAAPRWRVGAQPTSQPIVGAIEVLDTGAPNECTTPKLTRFRPVPVDPASTEPPIAPTVANVADQYFEKTCLRCHVASFGTNDRPGQYRSSGCAACHMPSADDGLTRGTDPWVDSQNPAHPLRHQLTRLPPITQCAHCHSGGARIALSYQGLREAGANGLNPPHARAKGYPLYGLDAGGLLEDEDTTNGFDETPPDVHFEAGMHCADCHRTAEIHGDGRIHADARCSVTVTCGDCHGTVRATASPKPEWPALVRATDGTLTLNRKSDGKALRVPQLKDAVTPGHPRHNPVAEQVMGLSASGTSHTDTVACETCHSAFVPTCYGCHVTMDFTRYGTSLSTGAQTYGAVEESRRYVSVNDLVLLKNRRGLLAPSMPAERLFFTVLSGPTAPGETGSKKLYAKRPAAFTDPDGSTRAAFGQRPIQPHTIRKRSQFQACDRCHSVGSVATPTNALLLDLTHGYGTQRFPEWACDASNDGGPTPVTTCDQSTDFVTYQLDAVQTREHKPLVVLDPKLGAALLSKPEVDRMRAIVVPEAPPVTYRTAIPKGAAVDPFWPRVTEERR